MGQLEKRQDKVLSLGGKSQRWQLDLDVKSK